MRGTNRKIQCKVGILHIALLREACLDHNMILSNFPQKLFWKPLQSLKLTMGRKSALLTRYLGRREIIRPKSDGSCKGNWRANRNYHCYRKYRRPRMAKASFPIHRPSSSPRKPVAGRYSSNGNGFHYRGDCDSIISRRYCCAIRGNAEFGWGIRGHITNPWTDLGFCWSLAGILQYLVVVWNHSCSGLRRNLLHNGTNRLRIVIRPTRRNFSGLVLVCR